MEQTRRFWSDTRGIEGLPVRLVIALVVGVASLSVMMNMISGISGLAVTELDVQPEPEVVSPGHHTIDVSVVDPDGKTISGATVIARGGSASLDGVETAKTNEEGVAELALSPKLRPNQRDGTIDFEVKPPAGGEYVDKRGNTAVLVVAE